MPGATKFTDLRFWQRSRTWSKEIFFLTKRDAFSTDRRLVVQVNDSSESVMANIAEGFGRGTQGEFIQFIGYALGSLNETQAGVDSKPASWFRRSQSCGDRIQVESQL